jgi:Protein of unknown function (DUF1552)
MTTRRSVANFDRRKLLQALGVGGAAALLRGATGSARAAGPDIPRRLVFFYTQQGTLRNLWAPTGTETDYTLGELHRDSLEPYKKSLLFLDGLEMHSNEVDPIQPGNAHYAGTTHALTGVNRQSGTLPSASSIDQYIASEINKGAPLTKVPSLELAVRDISFGEWAVSFGESGAPIPFETDPGKAYDRVFGDFVKPDDSAAQARAAQDDAVLAWAAGEFDATSSKLDANDKTKLAAHAEALRDLQARLKLAPSAACTQPTREGEKTYAGNWYGASAYTDITDMHMRLAAAALACDRTRVVTIALPELPSSLVGYTPGALGATDLHDLVHKTAENGALKDDPNAVAPIKRYHQLHAKQFATLLGLLQALPESDGGSLLDHTLVLWCGQLGSGSHDLTQLPWILAGGGGGFVKSGRHVKYDEVGGHGPSHNDLFVSLANYMGLTTTSFGNSAVSKGPLSRLSS